MRANEARRAVRVASRGALRMVGWVIAVSAAAASVVAARHAAGSVQRQRVVREQMDLALRHLEAVCATVAARHRSLNRFPVSNQEAGLSSIIRSGPLQSATIGPGGNVRATICAGTEPDGDRCRPDIEIELVPVNRGSEIRWSCHSIRNDTELSPHECPAPKLR